MNDEEPKTLDLGPGIDVCELSKAILASGYPLQIEVQELLGNDYLVQAEWGFKDRVTGESRAIDLLATRDLYPIGDVNKYRVRPTLKLLIECKRSGLPWIFFGSGGTWGDFPSVMGLHSDNLVLATNNSKSTWEVSVVTALGLDHHPFLLDAEATTTFAGTARQSGKGLKLTGSEAYFGSILPLRSAVDHLQRSLQPRSTYQYFEAALVVGLLVVDAPMIRAARGIADQPELRQVHWQRLWRHEPQERSESGYLRGRMSAIDVVHKAFLSEYLEQHLMPFATQYASLAQKHHDELATGRAFARDLEKGTWKDLESRLRPRPSGRDRVK